MKVVIAMDVYRRVSRHRLCMLAIQLAMRFPSPTRATPAASDAGNVTIHMAVLANISGTQELDMHLIQPALEIATHAAHADRLPAHIRLNFSYWATPQPDYVLLRFLIDRRSPLVCIGPVTDIQLEYVARMSAYKRVPVITPGGLYYNFGVSKTKAKSVYNRKQFETLIRLGPNHNSLSLTMIKLFNKYKFRKVKVLIEKHDTVLNNCFLLYGALDYYLNLYRSADDARFQSDIYLAPRNFDVTALLLTEVATEYASKWFAWYTAPEPL